MNRRRPAADERRSPFAPPAVPPVPALADPPTHTSPPADADGPRLARVGEEPRPARASKRSATRRLAAVRRLHGARRRATWRQRLVEAERGLVLGFRRDGVLAGHLFVLTLAVAAGVTFELNSQRWALLMLALSGAMAAELFGQVLAALAAATAKGGGDDADQSAELAGAVRLCSAAVAVAALGACGALVAVFEPAVSRAFGG